MAVLATVPVVVRLSAAADLEVIVALTVPPEQLRGLRIERWRAAAAAASLIRAEPSQYKVGNELQIPVACSGGDRYVLISEKFVSEPIAMGPADCDGRILRPRMFYSGRAYGRMSGEPSAALPPRFDLDVERCHGGVRTASGADVDPVGAYPVRLSKAGDWETILPADCLNATVRVEHYPHFRLARVRVPVSSSVSFGTISLWQYASIAFDVRDASDNRPVGGAQVCLLEPEAFASQMLALQKGEEAQSNLCGQSTASGRVTFDRVSPGVVHVVVRAAGYAPALAEALVLTPGERVTAETLRVHRYGSLRVTAQLPKSKAKRSFQIQAIPILAGITADRATVFAALDEYGTCEIGNLVPGPWRIRMLSAGAEGNARMLQEKEADVQGGAQNDVFFAPDVETYRGRVTLGGRPVAGWVRLDRIGADGGVTVSINTECAEDGLFEATLPEPGAYNVTVRSPNRVLYGAVAQCQFLSPTSVVPIELPVARIVVSVVDNEDRPVPAATVTVGSGTLAALLPPDIPGQPSTVVTDNTGIAEIAGVSDGSWILRAAEGLRRSEPVETTVMAGRAEAVRLVLPASSAVRGRVLSSRGEPLPSVPGFILLEGIGGPGGLGVATFVTGGGGEFTLQLDPPSTTMLNIQVFDSRGVAAFRVPVSAALDLRMPEQTGAVVLRLPGIARAAAPNPYSYYLVNDQGAIVTVSLASSYGAAFGVSKVGESILTVPRLAPGHWRVVRYSYGASLPIFLFRPIPQDSWIADFSVLPGRQTHATATTMRR